MKICWSLNLPLFGFTVYETYLVHRLRGEINAKVDYKRGFSEEHKRQREFFSILATAIIFTKYTSLIRISFEFNSKTRKAGRFSGFGHPNSQLKIRIEDRQQVMGCLRVTKCSPLLSILSRRCQLNTSLKILTLLRKQDHDISYVVSVI